CARGPMNRHIGERHPRAESCAERLQHRFLGREATSQALDPIDPVTDFIKFCLYEAAGNQRIARIVNPSLQLRDNHQINAVTYDVQPGRLSSRALYESQNSLM
ncbi:MAG TPA: hypothetical protein VF194_13225, partial [Ferrovibrio sp.]|uniref:hypothetical protein n=1 Tax=Ferrovibrio sp. TaxID=1917215 RepID=UPI002ED0530F